MLVILAARQDETAEWLADRWQPHNAVLLSAIDLSTSGWSFYLPSSGESRACIGGRKVRNKEIDGVLTRIQRVHGQELNHIMPSDRQYVASEMTAFLFAWLSSLTCPVLNRPTSNCLSGPGWRTEEWIRLASRLGIAVSAVRRRSSDSVNNPEDRSSCEVVVAGDECFGKAAPVLLDNARMLARAAGTDFLSVRFTGPEADRAFVSASLWPDPASPEIADAVLRRLQGRSGC